jgi:hypothetical protein
MKNNKTETFTFKHPKSLTTFEPLDLLLLIHNGELTRIDAWKLLREIHAGKYACNLSHYGILTVYSLSKDTEQFKDLYEQGCEMVAKHEKPDPVNESEYNIKIESLFSPLKKKKINLTKNKKNSKKSKNTKTKNKNA